MLETYHVVVLSRDFHDGFVTGIMSNSGACMGPYGPKLAGKAGGCEHLMTDSSVSAALSADAPLDSFPV